MSYSLNIPITATHEEEPLIRACVAQERWAQQVLYEQFYSNMMAVCLRYSNNSHDALDILHEGFIKVFRHIGSYQTGTSLSSWIRRIMVNTAIDFYRKQIKRRTEDLDTAFSLSSSEPDIISHLSAQDILAAVQQLSPVYRTVFNMFVIEGYHHKEIAEELGITESTSRSNLVKARGKLQEILKGKLG